MTILMPQIVTQPHRNPQRTEKQILLWAKQHQPRPSARLYTAALWQYNPTLTRSKIQNIVYTQGAIRIAKAELPSGLDRAGTTHLTLWQRLNLASLNTRTCSFALTTNNSSKLPTQHFESTLFLGCFQGGWTALRWISLGNSQRCRAGALHRRVQNLSTNIEVCLLRM